EVVARVLAAAPAATCPESGAPSLRKAMTRDTTSAMAATATAETSTARRLPPGRRCDEGVTTASLRGAGDRRAGTDHPWQEIPTTGCRRGGKGCREFGSRARPVRPLTSEVIDRTARPCHDRRRTQPDRPGGRHDRLRHSPPAGV